VDRASHSRSAFFDPGSNLSDANFLNVISIHPICRSFFFYFKFTIWRDFESTQIYTKKAVEVNGGANFGGAYVQRIFFLKN